MQERIDYQKASLRLGEPRLVTHNCITCDLGNVPLNESKACWDCITKEKSRWRKRKRRRMNAHTQRP